jgi:hypothetical protein
MIVWDRVRSLHDMYESYTSAVKKVLLGVQSMIDRYFSTRSIGDDSFISQLHSKLSLK